MRGVSTVVGTVLLVAVTVILAGTVSILLPSASVRDPAPKAAFTAEHTDLSGQPDEVTIRMVAGNEIDNDDLYVVIEGTEVQEEIGSPGPAARLSWSTLGDSGSTVKQGDTVIVEPRDTTPDMKGRTVYLVYDNGNTETTVATLEPEP